MRRDCLRSVARCAAHRASRRPRIARQFTSQYGALVDEIEATKLADAWARANPSLARSALACPSKSARDQHSAPPLDGLEWYAGARGYDVPADGQARTHALRLLSHALTYPLTLALYIKKSLLQATCEPFLRIVVVGARAESSLPASVWAELSCALPQVGRWQLLLIGPQVVPTRRLSSTETVANLRIACRKTLLHRDDDLAVLFSNTFDEENAGDRAGIDIVALFNPGLGHPRLAHSWEDAMGSIYRARPRALLVTSFSQDDLDSDLHGLARALPHVEATDLKWLVMPERNVFSSRRHAVDPENYQHVTAANERAFVVEFPPPF